MPISRMQQPRQQYGLGSFVKKAVKGVTGAVKKIAKSPLGLAAIGLGINQFGIPFMGGKGQGFLGNIFKGGIPGLDAAKKFLGGEKTFGKTLGVMAGGTLLGGLLSKAEEGDEEAIAATRNVGALRSYLDKGYRNLGYKEDEIPALVEEGVAEYTSAQGGYAAGGRVKFGNGSDDKSEMVKRVEELMDDGYDFGSAVKKYMEETREKEAMGGRIGYDDGTNLKKNFLIKKGYRDMVENMSVKEIDELFNSVKGTTTAANTYREPAYMGGRIGYDIGSSPIRNMAIKMNSGRGPITKKDYIDIYEMAGYDKDVATSLGTKHYKTGRGQDSKTQGLKNGGRIGYAFGNKPEQNAIQAAGIEGLPLNQNPAGVTELDLRDSGGFIPPVGVKEKADDIPAMLANNEFVFTADAVRGMGDGNVNKGAQRMYDMMKKLEKGGKV